MGIMAILLVGWAVVQAIGISVADVAAVVLVALGAVRAIRVILAPLPESRVRVDASWGFGPSRRSVHLAAHRAVGGFNPLLPRRFWEERIGRVLAAKSAARARSSAAAMAQAMAVAEVVAASALERAEAAVENWVEEFRSSAAQEKRAEKGRLRALRRVPTPPPTGTQTPTQTRTPKPTRMPTPTRTAAQKHRAAQNESQFRRARARQAERRERGPQFQGPIPWDAYRDNLGRTIVTAPVEVETYHFKEATFQPLLFEERLRANLVLRGVLSPRGTSSATASTTTATGLARRAATPHPRGITIPGGYSNDFHRPSYRGVIVEVAR